MPKTPTAKVDAAITSEVQAQANATQSYAFRVDYAAEPNAPATLTEAAPEPRYQGDRPPPARERLGDLALLDGELWRCYMAQARSDEAPRPLWLLVEPEDRIHACGIPLGETRVTAHPDAQAATQAAT